MDRHIHLYAYIHLYLCHSLHIYVLYKLSYLYNHTQ